MSGFEIKRNEGGKRFPIAITPETAIARKRYVNNIEFHRSDKGTEYLTIEIIDDNRGYSRTAIFPPKLGQGYIKTQEDLNKEQQRVSSILRNLTNVLLSPRYETGAVASFSEFCNKIISDLGKSYVGKELRVKLVLDRKNEPVLPKWPLMFEDPTVVPDNATKLVIKDREKVKVNIPVMDADPEPPKQEVTPKNEDELPW